MVCDASRTSKSQENGPFHRNVWLGLNIDAIITLATSVIPCACDDVSAIAYLG